MVFLRSSSSAHGWLSLPPLNMDHTAGCGMTWRITQTVKLSPSGCQAQPIHLLSQLVEIQAQLLHPVRVSYTQLLGTTELTGFVGAATAHVADKPMSCAGHPFRFPNYKNIPCRYTRLHKLFDRGSSLAGSRKVRVARSDRSPSNSRGGS